MCVAIKVQHVRLVSAASMVVSVYVRHLCPLTLVCGDCVCACVPGQMQLTVLFGRWVDRKHLCYTSRVRATWLLSSYLG